MKRLVVLSGAGMSADSGISTFRDAGGLWEGHDVMEVASPQGWYKNQELVLDFYNQRRKNVLDSEPNAGHLALASLESDYDVQIITQNIDDLHERAGSTNILHLHGEILKVQSTQEPKLIYDWKKDLVKGDLCEKGSQLRPHIVWFGEGVPMIGPAMEICTTADIVVVIGTSMAVYPAAGLINYVASDTPKYLIDPNIPDLNGREDITFIQERAATGVRKLIETFL